MNGRIGTAEETALQRICIRMDRYLLQPYPLEEEHVVAIRDRCREYGIVPSGESVRGRKIYHPAAIKDVYPAGWRGRMLERMNGMPLAEYAEGIDREVAAAYLRLLPEGGEDDTVRRLREAGIAPEPDPAGHWTMNYAALALHRRDNWLAGVRGHSRYLWSHETYPDCNLYGRYITYGHLQIMSCGDPVNNADSGYVPEGWDWNRWPGTTVVHVPLERLRAQLGSVDARSGHEEMLLSDETFAGGLHLEGANGMFAMKLHEHPKYDGTHRARKSCFFFDNRIVALGSDIENGDRQHPTETTLFQCHLAERSEPIWIDDGTGANEGGEAEQIRELPYYRRIRSERGTWLIDPKENGYWIPAGHCLSVSRAVQKSKHHKIGSDTSGCFAAAWIEHGCAPQSEEYEYAILVRTHPEHMRRFAAAMADPATALYTVLRKDRIAHIVRDTASGTVACALFEPCSRLEAGPLRAVDTPLMAMLRQEGDERLVLSVVDPDLRLYEGLDPDQYDENGVLKEASVYSRPWARRESKASRMTLALQGDWRLADNCPNCRVRASEMGHTMLEFDCKDAAPVEVTLLPALGM